MCGIIGYVGKNDAIKNLKNGLKKLEYRGYDSAGIAFFDDKELKIIKSVGKVENLFSKFKFKNSNIGIGHTRWATNGKADIKNCHPHQSEGKKVCLVHNGIIENAETLKTKFLTNIKFKSQTDTEVICNLIEYFLSKNNDKIYAIQSATKLLRGSYSLAILFGDEPEKIYFAKNKSPLLIGIGQKQNFIASDILGFANKTNKYIVLKDNQIGWISKSAIAIFEKNSQIEPKFQVFDKTINETTKGNFQHYMLKEINQIPECLNEISRIYSKECSPFFKIDKDYLKNIEKICLVACGTSFHACLCGEKYFRKLGFDAFSEIASEFVYSPPKLTKNTLYIFVSQSGETADTISAIKTVKQKSVKTIAITNVETSQIAKLCDYNLPIFSGPEIAVASTKAYNCQIAVLLLFANFLKQNDIIYLAQSIQKAAKHIDIKSFTRQIMPIVNIISNSKNVFICGKNFDYITALESALKIKEITYINCQGIASGEFKHGTIALVDENTTIFALLTEKNLYKKTINIVNQTKARGAKIVAITNCKNDNFSKFDYVIKTPKTKEILSPLVSIVPMQLLAYFTAIKLGYNPDKPRNLAKSVTVE